MIEIRADRRRENLSTADEVVVIILYEVEITLYWDIVFAEQAEDSTLQMFLGIIGVLSLEISIVRVVSSIEWADRRIEPICSTCVVYNTLSYSFTNGFSRQFL